MSRVNVFAVLVSAFAASVASAVWYLVLGAELAEVSPAFAHQQPAVWKMLVVFSQNLILSSILAYLMARLGSVGFWSAARIGAVLWLGLSALQWVGSMLWEAVPLKMAAIHAGDWLVKLVLICVIVGVWRKRSVSQGAASGSSVNQNQEAPGAAPALGTTPVD